MMNSELVSFAANLRQRGDFYSPEECAQMIFRAAEELRRLDSGWRAANMNVLDLKIQIDALKVRTYQAEQECGLLKSQAANANFHSLRARPDHMAHLCALAHSAVSLMILPPFARDAHKLRADGTLEPQSTKDTP